MQSLDFSLDYWRLKDATQWISNLKTDLIGSEELIFPSQPDMLPFRFKTTINEVGSRVPNPNLFRK